MDPEFELYSEERLESFLKEKCSLSATEIVKATFADVHNYAKEAQQSDDITVLAVKYI
jgi:sigma-B regulation protein RsbU (phosphoserine phosphatase)